MKKWLLIFLALVVAFMNVGCGSNEMNPSSNLQQKQYAQTSSIVSESSSVVSETSIEQESSAVAETQANFDSFPPDEQSSLADEQNSVDEKTSIIEDVEINEDPEYFEFVRETDYSAVTSDGRITESFDYYLGDDGKFYVDVTITNNWDQEFILDCEPSLFAETDLAKHCGAIHTQTADWKGTTLASGESVVKSVSAELEENWSSAAIELWLNAFPGNKGLVSKKYGFTYNPSTVVFSFDIYP